MALPTNRIKKIQTPNEDVYDIVPEMLGKDGYSAELPTLTTNSTIALTSNIPSTYLKTASYSGNTLTLTKQDNTTVVYTPSFDDSNLVHKTGNETINGAKTFTNNIIMGDPNVPGSSNGIALYNQDTGAYNYLYGGTDGGDYKFPSFNSNLGVLGDIYIDGGHIKNLDGLTFTLPSTSGTLALTSDIPDNYVTTNTDQTINSVKTYKKYIYMNKDDTWSGNYGGNDVGHGVRIVAPNMVANNRLVFLDGGKSLNLNNSAHFDFGYVANQSTDNYINFGFYANDNRLKLYANGILENNGDIKGTTFYEGGTSLVNKYLGISAKAADSDLLDGNDSTYYLDYNNLTNKPTITDTKNTTGSTNDTSLLYLIGAKTQADNPQTYSRNNTYINANGVLVNTTGFSSYNYATSSSSGLLNIGTNTVNYYSGSGPASFKATSSTHGSWQISDNTGNVYLQKTGGSASSDNAYLLFPNVGTSSAPKTLATTDDIPAVLGTGASNKDKYLHTNASTGALEWSSVTSGPTTYLKSAGVSGVFSNTLTISKQDDSLVTFYNYFHSPTYPTGAGLLIASGRGVIDLYVPYANGSQAGVVSADSQTFAGTKTFKTAYSNSYGAVMPNTSSYTANKTIATTDLISSAEFVEVLPSTITVTFSESYSSYRTGLSIYDGSDDTGTLLYSIASGGSITTPQTLTITSGNIFISTTGSRYTHMGQSSTGGISDVVITNNDGRGVPITLSAVVSDTGTLTISLDYDY